MSADILPLLPAITDFLVSTLVLDPNVLRDSTLQRIELMHFIGNPARPPSPVLTPPPPPHLPPTPPTPTAYVHVNAIMWHCGFAKLRALTNGSCVELNPLELNKLYEKLWTVGTTLQGPEPLTVLDPDFRPWPKVKQELPKVAQLCDD